MSILNKPKIQKTNRVRIYSHQTIYCSYKVITILRPHLFRMQTQIMVPLKDHRLDVIRELRRLRQELPEHFPESSRAIIDTL